MKERNKIYYLLPILIFMLITGQLTVAYSQSTNNNLYAQNEVDTNYKSAKMVLLVKALKKVEQSKNVTFLYSSGLLEGEKISQKVFESAGLANKLGQLLLDRGLTYIKQGGGTYVIRRLPNLKTVPQKAQVSGTVIDAVSGKPLIGANILVVGTSHGATTDANGKYQLTVPSLQDTLRISYIGYTTKKVPIDGRTHIDVKLKSKVVSGQQLVVVGYGKQKKKSITGAISSVNAKSLDVIHNGIKLSQALAGQIAGVSFRQATGKPGAGASIQIRNMGQPLFVIDGVIVSKGQFDSLSPNSVKSITVLKGAQAAIYGSRAANGVVVVTTKGGSFNKPTKIGIDVNYGRAYITSYINNVLTKAGKWKRYAAEAQLNTTGHTNITPKEIKRWKHPEKQKYPVKWESFDWPGFIFKDYAPQTRLNAHVSGGSNKTKYYFSASGDIQNAIFHQYKFNKSTALLNVTSNIKKNLKIGIHINADIQRHMRPNAPGVNKYGDPLRASLRNRPTVHPYANNNPKYLNDIPHFRYNAAFWRFDENGRKLDRWWNIRVNFHGRYNIPIIKGLSIKGLYSYYYHHHIRRLHTYHAHAYTYKPATDTYIPTGGKLTSYQKRVYQNGVVAVRRGQLNYKRSFGKHYVNVTIGTEWRSGKSTGLQFHAVPPINPLNVVQFNTIDSREYYDRIGREARISYYGRINYNYGQTYYLEFSSRYDASWKFPPNKRWGFFPAVSVGWRLSNEPFFQSLIGENSILSNLKIRASYGQLGDDNIPIGNFEYIPGYIYGQGIQIYGGDAINTTASRGVPVTNISWFKATDFDIGIDFGLWNGKLTGSLDYFHRKRTGLLANRYKAVIPALLGYTLPQQNQNSDAQVGGEIALAYSGSNGRSFTYKIGTNVGYSRHKFLHSFNPLFGNSWDRYRHSRENRWTGIFWGQQVIGRFQSKKQINNYPVNIDGKGNTTLLPGDFIYKDVNGDGVINRYDKRPIGYATHGQPFLYGGLQFHLGWKGIDFSANFSFGSLYSHNRTGVSKVPFRNNGNLVKAFLDRWHLKDYRDPNSKWIPGHYPALRFNDNGQSNYISSDFWLINVYYFRLRTLSVGYTLPVKWTENVNLEKVRFYINTYNLFSIDNMPSYIDAGIKRANGQQYPQMKYVSIGLNVNF